ncbi:DoxX family protein [Streptomyces spiralis]|uniref:DoxX family protein n=1 Tax=Streptomyces spiralis TaxID=66376 RepID=UPI0036946D3D
MIKFLAAAGLVTGIYVAGIGVAANAGVVCYFRAAAYAHVRARFPKPESWLNCLGLLALSVRPHGVLRPRPVSAGVMSPVQAVAWSWPGPRARLVPGAVTRRP